MKIDFEKEHKRRGDKKGRPEFIFDIVDLHSRG